MASMLYISFGHIFALPNILSIEKSGIVLLRLQVRKVIDVVNGRGGKVGAYQFNRSFSFSAFVFFTVAVVD